MAEVGGGVRIGTAMYFISLPQHYKEGKYGL